MNNNRITLVLFLLILPPIAQSKTYFFDPTMLGHTKNNVDISLFNLGVQQPGTYKLDIMLNSTQLDSRDVTFRLKKDGKDGPVLVPCLTISQLSRYGVKTEDYPRLLSSANKNNNSEECVNINAIPKANATLDLNNQQLLLSIPQIALRPKLVGIAPEESWDDGISAFLMNYNGNITRSEYHIGAVRRSDASWVQLQPGVNIGAWRFRNSTNWQNNSQRGDGRWQRAYTYAERGLYSRKSRLTLGERSTPGDIFDSVPFRGIMLGSDDSMIPYNMKQFAPLVEGIARTQARVQVKDDGYTIYNATVSPGPFALRDLSVTNGNGDLQVTVWETDGAPQKFTVQYQTPAIALREGYFKYNVMAGYYRPSYQSSEKVPVGQATLMYGLPLDMTAYGGVQEAEYYQAASLGLGASLGFWGSVSVDASGAKGLLHNNREQQGAIWRVRYSNQLQKTGTYFSVSSRQSISPGYLDLAGVLDSYRYGVLDNERYSSHSRLNSRTTMSLGQSLGRFGRFRLNGSIMARGGNQGNNKIYSFGYDTSIGDVSFSLNVSQNRARLPSGEYRKDRRANLWMSIPLDIWGGDHARANWQLTSHPGGEQTQDIGLSGQAFDRQLDWGLSQNYRTGSRSGEQNSSSMHFTWNGPYAQWGGNYSYGPSVRQYGLNAMGGVLIHHRGVTFGQPFSDTLALAIAPGASDISVGGWPGVKTDFRGYTTVSGLTPYKENIVNLNPTQLPSNTEIIQTDTKVVPTRGAVVEAKFKTSIGSKAFMTIRRDNGGKIPFGAQVKVYGKEGYVGIVDDNSLVYLTGLLNKGELVVAWGEEQCKVKYSLPNKKNKTGFYHINSICY
ncbi:fimbrial biogenesis outer membrane usher protein [Yersinia rochesterensis]|uniref:fimbrial biogenesis outer membrane usher protein n=1 Tax=Yersinia rochesterensis TaxID=1604335 RepID=UPI0025AA5C90|nr:fimbrial biogenesis outer membrane usher protein [Yersinia rochesterensis]MDN0108838.1 fimbrial biogenesis outer membrane usher protein [Yersinia rochesterensis]